MNVANLKEQSHRIVFHRPLVSIETALTLIGVDRREKIVTLVEEGQLRWAFDISLKQAQRREIRILGESLNDFLAGNPAPAISERDDFDLAMQAVFPTGRAAITAFEISRAWNSSPDHILNLCQARQLRLVKGTCCRRGRGGSPMVITGSAVEFLRQRRLL